MWGHYGQYEAIVEKKGQRSEWASDNSDKNISRPYVLNDITTFFTLLVGIYFPSVTGIVYKKQTNKQRNRNRKQNVFLSTHLYHVIPNFCRKPHFRSTGHSV